MAKIRRIKNMANGLHFVKKNLLLLSSIAALIMLCQLNCLGQNNNSSTGDTGESSQTKPDLSGVIQWSKPVAEGPDQMFYFAEAVSGKTLKQDSFELLHGVTAITIQKNKIVIHRNDNEELALGAETEHGGKFFSDWEKSKINLEAKFGVAGREFLESIQKVQLNGDRIEVLRSGDENTTVDMGEHKLHHAFDLRGLHFTHLSMEVDASGEHPCLKDIQGVSAQINAPGFNFPVELKEFGKVRMEKNNDITVGVRNPVPMPVRIVLFLPDILRFHFALPRKESNDEKVADPEKKEPQSI